MLNPWATVAKVKSIMPLHPDEQVLFKGGDTWHEDLEFAAVGAIGHPWCIGTYGSGRAIFDEKVSGLLSTSYNARCIAAVSPDDQHTPVAVRDYRWLRV